MKKYAGVLGIAGAVLVAFFIWGGNQLWVAIQMAHAADSRSQDNAEDIAEFKEKQEKLLDQSSRMDERTKLILEALRELQRRGTPQ